MAQFCYRAHGSMVSSRRFVSPSNYSASVQFSRCTSFFSALHLIWRCRFAIVWRHTQIVLHERSRLMALIRVLSMLHPSSYDAVMCGHNGCLDLLCVHTHTRILGSGHAIPDHWSRHATGIQKEWCISLRKLSEEFVGMPLSLSILMALPMICVHLYQNCN